MYLTDRQEEGGCGTRETREAPKDLANQVIRGLHAVEPPIRIELMTFSLRVRRSTD